MGCCNSTLDGEKGDQRGPRPAEGPLVIPTVTWDTVESWEPFYREDISQGADDSKEAQFARARKWLGEEYPECSMRGTIEDLGESRIPTNDGPCKYPSKSILTLDSTYTGVLIAHTMVLAVTSEKDTGAPELGAMLETPEMGAAKLALLTMITRLERDNPKMNLKHADLHVIMGADMLRCKFHPEYNEPSMTPVHQPRAGKIAEVHKKVARQVSRDPEGSLALRGMFLPMTFRGVVQLFADSNPGCTVWDGGELPFEVQGVPYPFSTRLIVARRFENTKEEVEATHYRVLAPDTKPSDKPVVIMRGSNPEQALASGVVYVELLVAISQDVIWPAPGAYAGKPAFKAATAALLGLLKKLNKEGKLHTCVTEVEMGADRVKLSFVGDRIEPIAAEKVEGEEEVVKKVYSDLSGFNIKLEEQRKHELFESESQFQAIKKFVRERAMQDPERYAAQAPFLAHSAAHYFLENNFPGCEISDEGPIPITMNGEIVNIASTGIVLGKDPKQSQKNIIAVIMLIPLPGKGGFIEATEKSWLDTKEIKVAEAVLLDLMKKWHKEGKIADDCMAKVAMGVDATIYKFVDGEKFEDYDDDRMKQFKWG